MRTGFNITVVGSENMDAVKVYMLKHYKENGACIELGTQVPIGLTVYPLEVHNEHATNTDYVVYVYGDDEGVCAFYSGSESLANSYAEAQELPAGEYVMECILRDSKKGSPMKLFKAVRV